MYGSPFEVFCIRDVWLRRFFIFHQFHVIDEIEASRGGHAVVDIFGKLLDSSLKVIVTGLVVFGSKDDVVEYPNVCPLDFDFEYWRRLAGFGCS